MGIAALLRLGRFRRDDNTPANDAHVRHLPTEPKKKPAANAVRREPPPPALDGFDAELRLTHRRITAVAALAAGLPAAELAPWLDRAEKLGPAAARDELALRTGLAQLAEAAHARL
ncbi:MAG: hypothetical protein ACFCUW_15185, partial [Kiloniellaceae bacterium]